MGAGLPYSIGAAIASGRRIIHIEGDGGFQLNIQELETIRRLNLPIIMFIINNNGYASIRESQMRAFGRVTGADDTSGVTLPPLRNIAYAYDIDYVYCASVERVKSIASFDMPILVEVIADPAQQYRHRVKSKLIDGKMTTAPMNEVT
jgi:acetolactate synthase-1/2/3 large subunit